jgi:hypothetical protein
MTTQRLATERVLVALLAAAAVCACDRSPDEASGEPNAADASTETNAADASALPDGAASDPDAIGRVPVAEGAVAEVPGRTLPKTHHAWAFDPAGVSVSEGRRHVVVRRWCDKLVECGMSESGITRENCFDAQLGALAAESQSNECQDALLDWNSCQAFLHCDRLHDCDYHKEILVQVCPRPDNVDW